MSLDLCPMPDELRLFLDEMLERSRQAQIGTHVDKCESCQSTLERLTRVEDSDLLETGLDVQACLARPGAEARASADRLEAVNGGTGEWLHPDTTAKVGNRRDGEWSVDGGVSTIDSPAGDTGCRDDCTDPEEPAGPVPAVRSYRQRRRFPSTSNRLL